MAGILYNRSTRASKRFDEDKRSMATSIKDIAKKLNVSVSTVSYALNGGPRRVSTEVRDRVIEAAKDLGYRPNRVAKSMVTGKSRTIGVVPPEIGEDVLLSPYLQLALNGVFNAAGKANQDLMLFTRLAESHHDEIVTTILDGRIDGAIFIAPSRTNHGVLVAKEMHIPCVTISNSQIEGVITMSVANRTGMNLVLNYLVKLGHRRIAHIAGRLDMQDAIERLKAYSDFVGDNRLPSDDGWVVKGQFHPDGGYRAMKELLSHPSLPTAVTCANDDMAIGAIRACRELGFRVPEDISITGFDMTTTSDLATPALTTVRQPIAEMGSAAVAAVLALLEDKEVPVHTVFQPTLVTRSSTCIPKKESK